MTQLRDLHSSDGILENIFNKTGLIIFTGPRLNNGLSISTSGAESIEIGIPMKLTIMLIRYFAKTANSNLVFETKC